MNIQLSQNTVSLPKNESVGKTGKIKWGSDDNYPEFLYNLNENCPLLGSLIKFTKAALLSNYNSEGEFGGMSYYDLVSDISESYLKYGICYIQRMRNKTMKEVKYVVLDAKKCRVDYLETNLWYGERKTKYPINDSSKSTDILVLKLNRDNIYSKPLYNSAMKSISILNEIDDYHFNAINNGISATAIINLNSGIPDDDQKDEVENGIRKKFSGAGKAGNFILSFNESKEKATEVISLDSVNYADTFANLYEVSRKNLFTVFNLTPNLIGDPTVTTGFSDQEYAESFKLFEKVILKDLKRSLKIFLNKLNKNIGYE